VLRANLHDAWACYRMVNITREIELEAWGLLHFPSIGDWFSHNGVMARLLYAAPAGHGWERMYWTGGETGKTVGKGEERCP
jgi:hypothetical protein